MAGFAAFGAARRHPLAARVGALTVLDREAAAVARLARGGADLLPVCLVNTSGAGGLLALGRRDLAGLAVVSVRSALRDLDDLAGNARRVVAAADGLADLPTGRTTDSADQEVTLRVELPDAAGWERAVEVVEAAGFEAAVRWPAGGRELRFAERLGVLVEADLAFAVLDAATTTPERLTGLFRLVDALVEGRPATEAAALVASPDPVRPNDDGQAARIRRRLRSVAVSSGLPVLLDRLSGS